MQGAKAACLRVSGRTALALVPALLMGAYTRWPVLAFIPYYSLVPWILLYTDDRQPRVSLGYYFVSAYIGWILFYASLFRFGWFVPLSMGLVLFLPMLAFAPLLRGIHHRLRWPRTVIVPIVWVAVEWLRATYTTAHLDMSRLGYSQARFPVLVQIADIVGAYGVSFLVAAVNGLIADGFFALRDHGWSVVPAWRTRRLVAGALAVAAGFGLASLYGLYRLGTARQTVGPKLAVVQPNVRHDERNAVGVHLTQAVLTDRGVGSSQADLIVWPENAILDDIRREGAYLDDLAWLARKKDALMLVGARTTSGEHPGRLTNSAVLVNGRGTILRQYDKQLLFPWSEYVPFDDLLRRISPPIHRFHRGLIRRGWGFLSGGVPGEEMVLFSMPWPGEELRFATLICVENVYPPLPAEAGRKGARFFVNITSEGEAGGPLQEQLLRICILRAIENRIPYVRAGNTGISCFIDAQGRVRSVLHGERGRTIDDAGVLIDRVPLSPGGTTWYAWSRDAFAKACVGLTLVLLGWSFLRPARAGRRGFS